MSLSETLKKIQIWDKLRLRQPASADFLSFLNFLSYKLKTRSSENSKSAEAGYLKLLSFQKNLEKTVNILHHNKWQ